MPTSCYGCGATLRLEGAVGRRTACPHCDGELHSCMNCRHYDESAAHGCREPCAEHVLEKDRANACDLFQLGDGASRRRTGGSAATRNALAALFGEAPAKEEDPKDALEALFRK